MRKKAHLYFLSFLIFLLSCISPSDSPQKVDSSNTVLFAIHKACFERVELCEQEGCRYGYTCGCGGSRCKTASQIFDVDWGAANRTDQEIIVKRITAEFLNQNGEVVESGECQTEEEIIEANASNIFRTEIMYSCSAPVEYEKSSMDFRTTILRYRFFYEDQDGEKSESVSQGIQVIE